MDDAQHIRLWLYGRPATTARAYHGDILRLKSSLCGKAFISADLNDLQRHLAELARKAPRTKRRAAAAIRSFYAFHLKCGTIEKNPALALALPKAPRGLTERGLSVEEVQRLIAAAPPLEAVMLRLLYVAGLRASELCGLRWRDVAADYASLEILGKGSKPRRVEVTEALAGDLAVIHPDHATAEDHVFAVIPRRLHSIVKRAAKAAGLSAAISPHFLRHSCASHALAAGASLALVRDHLGHQSVATTNQYLHAEKGDSAARYLKTR